MIFPCIARIEPKATKYPQAPVRQRYLYMNEMYGYAVNKSLLKQSRDIWDHQNRKTANNN